MLLRARGLIMEPYELAQKTDRHGLGTRLCWTEDALARNYPVIGVDAASAPENATEPPCKRRRPRWLAVRMAISGPG